LFYDFYPKIVLHTEKFYNFYSNEVLITNLEFSYQVGHSIGAYISIEMFKKNLGKVTGFLHISLTTNTSFHLSIISDLIELFACVFPGICR